MVVRARQMRREDQREVAGRACGRKVADFGFASTAQVPSLRQIAVAGAEGGFVFHYSGWKAHHQQRCLVLLLRFGVCSA